MKNQTENVASSDHIALSDFIKKVHKQLREKSRMVGSEEAWDMHCADEKNLKHYARAMKELATNHWENSNNVTRIIWTYNTCNNYFAKDIFDIRHKEIVIAKKIDLKLQPYPEKFSNRRKLLDVGSCYNPYQQFHCFEVIAVDIAPAVSEVFQGDFLKLEVGETTLYDNKKLSRLQQDFFDIIVFSLFLEYLPSPEQRKLCCEKAYRLLKTEGILILITPDSNHIGTNAKLMKSWQFVLAEMGFSRIKYEKLPHIHCMAFRKAFSGRITMRWAELHRKKQIYDQIYIPQDFNSEPNPESKEKTTGNESLTTIEIKRFNEELPFCDFFT